MTQTVEQKIQFLEQQLGEQPNSPRFAELASYYLEAGRPQDALSLCDQGLAHHPFYTTGHLIKGRTLLDLNMRAEARREFEFVHSLVPNSDTVTNYLKQLPPTADEDLTAPSPAPETQAPEIEETAVQPTLPPAAPQQEPETEQPPLAAETPEPEPTPGTGETPADPFGIAEATEETGVATPDEMSQPVTEESTSEPPLAESVEPQVEEPPVEESRVEEPPIEEPSALPEEPAVTESYEQFAERKRSELAGTENSMSLEEYLYGSSPEATASHDSGHVPGETGESEDPFAQLSQMAEDASPPERIDIATDTANNEDPFAGLQQDQTQESPSGETPEEKDQIEELTEKLQNAKKITPVINLSEKTSGPPEDSDSPTGGGFVTPTLAEIYAKQGWYDDAIKAYKALAVSKPAEREKFEARIRELEEMKNQQGDQGT